MASITTAAAQARVIKLLLLQAHLQAQVKLFPLHASLTAVATPLIVNREGGYHQGR